VVRVVLGLGGKLTDLVSHSTLPTATPTTSTHPPIRSPPRELIDQRLDDLHHQRTWVDVFPIVSYREPFNMGRFWNHAIQVQRVGVGG